MDCLISIIMPIYRIEESLLQRAIESVQAQSYRNWELIAVDDGDTMGGGQIADSYSRGDPRIRVIHQANAGVSAARNRALQVARGNYLFFLDSDDALAPNALMRLFQRMTETGADVAVASAAVVTYRGQTLPMPTEAPAKNSHMMSREEAIQATCYLRSPYEGTEFGSVWGKLFRRNVLSGVSFLSSMAIGEDFVFFFQVMQKVDRLVCLEDQLYFYTIRTSSALRNGFQPEKMSTLTAFQDFLAEESRKTDQVGYTYEDVRSRCVNIVFVLLLMIPVKSAYRAYREPVISFLKQNRFAVLKNRKTRKKVRFALLFSYLGFDFTQRLFTLFFRRK